MSQDNVPSAPASPQVAHWWDHPPQSEEDKFLKASENLLAAREKEEEIQLRKMTGHSVAFEFRKPRNILKTATAEPFHFDDVPLCIGHLAYDWTLATGFDPSGIVVAATVAAASVIHDEYKLAVRPETKWYESARLWAVLIGDPSSGKSPSIRAATDHIKTMHNAEGVMWSDRNKDVADDEREPRPQLYTSDTTIAALEESLKGNPQGILMLTEEFDTWIGAIDGTNRGEGAANRGNWLQLYDGGAKQTNRISRGHVFVPNWSASVLAAGTPDGLQKLMKQLPNDGLIHRFIPVIMSTAAIDVQGDARQRLDEWDQTLRRLRDNSRPGVVQMSQGARRIFEDEHRYVKTLVSPTYEFAPSLASAMGKHGGMLARVAQTFHGCTYLGETELRAETMWKAVLFLRKVRRHQAALFNEILGTSEALALAKSLGRSIVADGPLLTTVGRQWMSDHCADWKKADDRVRREAIQILEDADWLEQSSGARTYGGWPSKWSVHDQLSRMFSTEGEAWRARRAAVREAIGGDAD